MQKGMAIAGTLGIGIFSGIVLGSTGSAVNYGTVLYIVLYTVQTSGLDDRKQNTVKNLLVPVNHNFSLYYNLH